MSSLRHKYYLENLNAEIPTNGMVALWDATNIIGTNLNDGSIYDNDMTVVGSPAIEDSPRGGKTIKFDGTNIKYAIIPQTSSLQIGSVGSFYFRMKVPDIAQTNRVIFSKLIYLMGTQIYLACLVTGAGNSADNFLTGKKISLSINNGNVGTLYYTTNDVVDGYYHDYVININNGVFTFYMDGVQIPAINYHNGHTNINTTGADWTIGINAYNRTSGKLDADFDKLYIYNRNLLQSEITTLYGI